MNKFGMLETIKIGAITCRDCELVLSTALLADYINHIHEEAVEAWVNSDNPVKAFPELPCGNPETLYGFKIVIDDSVTMPTLRIKP